MSFLKEFWKYLSARRKWWLVPILVLVALVSGLLLLAQSSVVAPMIYTIF